MWSLDGDNGKRCGRSALHARNRSQAYSAREAEITSTGETSPPFIAQTLQRERAALVVMELIRPLRCVGAYLVRPASGTLNESQALVVWYGVKLPCKEFDELFFYPSLVVRFNSPAR
jgi:hypothetical protein